MDGKRAESYLLIYTCKERNQINSSLISNDRMEITIKSICLFAKPELKVLELRQFGLDIKRKTEKGKCSGLFYSRTNENQILASRVSQQHHQSVV